MAARAKRDYYEETSFVYQPIEPGYLWGFNVDHGFLEAIVRGYRSGFLTPQEYRALSQCHTLDDFKLCFNDSDYAGILEGKDADGGLTTNVITNSCYQKFVDEFMYLRNQAVGSLANFLNFVQYEYMIKNVMFLITGLVNGNDGKELLKRIDELGKFPRAASILTFENTDEGFLDLYRTVLIDTPIGKYFEKYFIAKTMNQGNSSMKAIREMMEESEIEVINMHIEKYWLEDFYQYCKKLGGMTEEVMCPLLEFRADMRSINIMLNSFDSSLNDPINRESVRAELLCNFGTLYPEGVGSFDDVGTAEELNEELQEYTVFAHLLDEAATRASEKGDNEDWSSEMSDVMQEHENKLCELAFEQQSHFGCFWAYCVLKQQEKKNIFWIAECISQKQMQAVDQYQPIFAPRKY